MVESEVGQLKGCAAEGKNSLLLVNRLVRQRRRRILDHDEPFLGPLVGNDLGACVFEGLAAGDVVEVMMAIDQVLDRLVSDFFDLVNVGCYRLRPSVTDGIGGDDAVSGD